MIQFKCKTTTTGDDVRYISYGLEKGEELSDDDIITARKFYDSCEGIEILDFNRSMELTKAEWDEILTLSNGAIK